MHPEGDEIDGMMLDALRGQGEEYDAEDYYDEEVIDVDSEYSDARSDGSWNYRTNTMKPNKKGMKHKRELYSAHIAKELGKNSSP